MILQDLQAVLRRQPFTPFRLFVSDGAVYDIRHSVLCVPGRRSVFIGIEESESNELVYDRYAIVDLTHVTRLEPLEKAPLTGNGAAS
jgi:hypothetical protein